MQTTGRYRHYKQEKCNALEDKHSPNATVHISLVLMFVNFVYKYGKIKFSLFLPKYHAIKTCMKINCEVEV
jgi:hypothetical protein